MDRPRLPGGRARCGALTELHGIPIVSVHAPTLLLTQRVWGPDPWTKVDKSIELAQEVGASTVVLHPPFRWQKEYARDFVEGVALREHETGIALAVENMFPWRARQREFEAYLPHWDPVPQAYDNVTLDLSHTATAGSDAHGDGPQRSGPRLAHVHLADGLGSLKDEHLVPGRGSQPCAEFLEMLAAQGFSGSVVVEVGTRKLTAGAARARPRRGAGLRAPAPRRGPAVDGRRGEPARPPPGWRRHQGGDPRRRRGPTSPSRGMTPRRCAGSPAGPRSTRPSCTTTSAARPQLFAAVMDIPADPAALIAAVVARSARPGRGGARPHLPRGLGLARTDAQRFQALIRSAVTHDEATRMLREFLTREVFGRVRRASFAPTASRPRDARAARRAWPPRRWSGSR